MTHRLPHLSPLRRLTRIARVWCRRAERRRLLATLDIRLLHDIGLRADDALAEARKPLWRD